MNHSTAAALQLPRGRQGRRRLWIGVSGALLLLLGSALYLGRHAPPPPPAASRDVPRLDGKVLRFTPAYAERIQLKAQPATEGVLTPTLHLVGQATYDARRVAALGARVSGRVRLLRHVVGDHVKAGEVVLEIESAELGRAQADALKARAREQAARIDAEREKRLAEAKVSAQRDAELANATYEAVKAERIAAERAVQALGGDLQGELGVVYLRSPLEGRVMAVDVAQGQSVQDSDTAVRVADLRHLWVELTLFERDLNAVQMGDPVEVRPQGVGVKGRQTFKGKVAYVGDAVDPEAHTATLRVEVDNPDGVLRPGLAVDAVVQASGPAAEYLSVPTSAVTRIDGKATVFVAIDPLGVEPRVVELGPESSDRVAVLRGLSPGDQVVVSGVFALKSESFR